jgi:hypothetical protein
MGDIDLAATAVFALLIAKALRPSLPIPVRHYDMFAHPLPDRRIRTAMVFHCSHGARVIAPAHVLPFEPARNTSILRVAASEGPHAIRQLGIASLRAQRRGWRAFDQVWGPPHPVVRNAWAVCVHVVDASQLAGLADADHSRCLVPLTGCTAESAAS